ncbi:hypothetical protein H6G80_03440 [Nostoc sp. FACHB-87]|uniref:hypothetical protein n=1 Tax=Nostocales TaxID=1161 RepID=UPI001688186A|nr:MULTISPECIES: hypothetical protein [Nostocales]MBD2298188.1 hypothetical protein [Nostoc sp. FACHB-190]MBD2453128.1 hypothetical protein [Nostoc sp. FACHB-87]MBD2475093.1 hypothetical protein [Anabaena sp. FACHB-83]MBD2489378.1 hypothetical protein [Aulosira sp. FACHB-615]
MESAQKASQELSLAVNTAPERSPQTVPQESHKNIFKKLRGGFLLVLGYLLSPLCWWNDIVFNLPIAYFFGYLCSLFSPKLFIPCAIVGYWLSNVVGILLMQYGSKDIFQKDSQERNLKKELLSGLVSSTIYTIVIILLIQLKILEAPVLFAKS